MSQTRVPPVGATSPGAVCKTYCQNKASATAAIDPSPVRPKLHVVLLVALSGLLYILQRPVSSNNILVPVLATLGLLATASLVRTGVRPARGSIDIVMVQFLAGSITLLIGSINDTPGLWSQALVLVAAPALFWTICLSLQPWMIRAIMTTLALGTVLLSSTILLFVFGEKGLLPQLLPNSLLVDSGAGLGFDGSSIQIRFYGLSTLVGAGPLWLASLSVPRNKFLPGLTFRSLAAVGAVLASLLTGRRALIVVLLLVPILTWVIRKSLTPRSTRSTRRRSPFLPILGSGIILSVVATQFLSGLYSSNIISNSLSSALNFANGTLPQDPRPVESSVLLNNWSENPIFGRGAGATIPGYYRDSIRPWNFELQYHMLLFTQGLWGALMFGTVLLLSIRLIRSAARHQPKSVPVLVASTVAAASMLIANASNPYLQAPGHMWAIYLPLGIANAVLTGSVGKKTTPDR